MAIFGGAAGPSVVVKFLTDTKGIQSAGKDVEASTTGIRGALGKVATAVGAAFVADKVVAFARDSIKSAQDLNANMSRTKTIFGDSSDSVIAWSKNAATSLRMSQSEALAASNTLGKTLVGSFGMSGAAAGEMSMGVVQLAKDMAVFNRVPFEEAMDKITAGMNGQARGLKTLGVNLSETEVKQKAFEMGLISTTKGAMDPAVKAQATYQVLLKKTALQQGATAKTSGSLMANQEMLTARWEDAKAQLGNALLPVMTQLSGLMTSQLMPVIAVVGNLFERFGVVLVPLVAIIAAVVAITKVWTIVQTTLNVVMSANPFGLVVLGIVALIAVIIIIIANFDTLKNVAQSAFNAVLGVAKSVLNWFKSNWPLLLGILLGPIGLAAALIYTHFDSIRNVAQSVVSFFQGVWSGLTSVLLAPITAATSGIVAAFNSLKGAIASAISGVTDVITAPFIAAKNLIESMVIAPIKAAWNTVARAINAVSFKLPEVKIPLGPTIGGQEISFPKLPMLQKGGVVNFPMLALLGEGGREIVAPEPLLREIIREESPPTRTGPAVVIEHATFSDQADIDLFMRQAGWAVETGSL